MQLQKFMPIGIQLNPFLDTYFNSQQDPYIEMQYELDSSIVTQTILSSMDDLIEIMQALAGISTERELANYVLNLPSPKKFLILACIKGAYTYDGGAMQKIPLFPSDKRYYHAFTYVLSTFLEFKAHCIRQHLDLWNEILSYEVSLLYPPTN